jgi:hypothetical protein
MKALSKGVRLAAATLALMSLTAATAAAAELPVWTISGAEVKEATPTTITGSFSITRESSKGLETWSGCTLKGKGTVNKSGTATITELALTGEKCARTGGEACEEGTVTKPTAINLPWTGKLAYEHDGSFEGVINHWTSSTGTKTIGFTWNCTSSLLGVLYTVTCHLPEERAPLTHEAPFVYEHWNPIEYSSVPKCETFIGKTLWESGLQGRWSGKPQPSVSKGELSFRE